MKPAACTLLLAAACAHAPQQKPVVWPDPPEVARIRFVRAFRQTEDLDTGGWSAFKRKLLGGSPDPALGQPMGLAISDDGQRLYIADYAAGAVFRADFAAGTLKPFAPDELRGRPFNVALDAEENVYVSDSTGRQVLVLSKGGERLRSFGPKEQLERPTGLAVDRKRGLVYVADSASRKSDRHRVLAYDLSGRFHHQLGATPSKGVGEGQFYFPNYLVVDGEGQVYVGDTMNFRIQVFDKDGKFVRKLGEQGDGPGTFSRIKGLAFDGFGNLYVADGDHSVVQIFSKDFEPLMFFGGFVPKLEYFDLPSGIAIDPRSNRIYVCNEHNARINVYELINTTAQDSPARRH